MMDRTAILLRVAGLVLALGLTALLLEFWGMASGIIGNYLSQPPPAPKGGGVVSVQVLPAAKDKTPPPARTRPAAQPGKTPPPK